MKELIKGSKGGGGGGGSSPTRTPDNLRSKDTVEAILGLGEGPIFGLENGEKSFFIGDTQLQNESGEDNFKYFDLTIHSGDEDPDPVIPVLGGTSSNHSVNLELASGVSVVRQTDNGDIDFLEVRLNITRLMSSTDDGTFNANMTLRLEYKPVSGNSGDWVKFYGKDFTISGKTTSAYVKEFRQSVARIDEPYEIRVTKVSDDTNTTYFGDVIWESYQEVLADNPTYPNTAIAHLVGEASDQFSSIPAFKGIYKGLIVKVPANYTPETRTYGGVWDGSFKSAWTDNPAWILYDFVMNDRYGIKSYYKDIKLDKYDVYEAGVWCDELVPDGKGGTQPRYTFNAYITEPRSGKELARYIAGSFNATFFDDLNGKAYLRVDRDETASHMFMPENVSEEGFEYSYVDVSTRYNDITVSFKNPDLSWATDRRRIFDQELIDKNGRIPHDFIAVGCINEHEAIRRGHYKLLTANTEICTVSFSTNRLGQFVNPFDTILIADPDMGYSLTGRLKSINPSNDSFTLRDPIYIEAGVPYAIQIPLEDGSIFQTSLIGDHPTGHVTEITVDAVLPDTVPEFAVFSLQNTETAGLPRPFRVLSVEEQDGSPDAYTIRAININRNKFYDSDNVTDSGTIQYSVLPSPIDPPPPTSVSFEERYIKTLKQFQIVVSPVFPRGEYKYYNNEHAFEVWSRPTNSEEAFVKREVLFGDTLVNHPVGQYDFKILGRSILGFTGDLEKSAIYTFTVTNPLDPPKDVDFVKINQKEVYWGYENAPDDFAGFIVRYHNQAGRITWEDAARPHQGILTKTAFYTNLIPPTARVILVRAVDDFGVTSVNSAVIFRNEGDIQFDNVIIEKEFHPEFKGIKNGCTVVSGDLVADDDGDPMYSGNPANPMYDGGDFYESTYLSMSYTSDMAIDGEGKLKMLISSTNNGYQTDIKSLNSPWSQVTSDMLIEEAEYNYMTNSVEFDHTDWDFAQGILNDAAEGDSSIVAPDGSYTTYKIIEDTSTDTRVYGRSTSTISTELSNKFTFSMYVKPSSNRKGFGLFLKEVTSVDEVSVFADVNLDSGTINSMTNSGGASPVSTDAGVIPLSDGWFRVWLTVEFAHFVDELSPYFYFSNTAGNGNENYTGDGTSYIHIWGAQINTGEMTSEHIIVGDEASNYNIRTTLFGGPNRGSIDTMKAIVDVPDIEEIKSDITIPASATRISLDKDFSTIKVVSVIIQNDGSSTAVNYRVIDKNTALGPQIELLDSDGSITSGLVDVIIKGY